MPQPGVATAALAWETLLDLGHRDAVGAVPLRDRLESAIRDAVQSGRIPPGAALPPSRALAETLGVSRWVVTEAYGQLVAEGFLESRVGSATRVPEGARAPRGARAEGVDRDMPQPRPTRPVFQRPPYDLGPGVPDLRHVPRARWADAVRRAISALPDAEFAVVDRLGHPLARTAVAAYLARSRRAIAAPDDVVITHGAGDAMAGLVAGLRAAGHSSLLVEDPSWPGLREVAASAGLTPVPVPVDDDGVDVVGLTEAAARTGARAALITPAHQFPLGAALAPARREAIVRWARERDAVLIEDDYDAEFRYDRRPIAALQAMAPERVVLIGSLSKAVAQAFGLGWALMPAALRERVHFGTREPVRARPSTLDQVALAQFIASGDLERHLRAARGRFRRRRTALLAAFERELPRLALTGIAAGMHAVLELPPGVTAADARAAASGLEVAVSDLTRYRVSSATASREALVVGYGNLSDVLVDEAVARLARAIRSLS
ncbi:MocR-like pyridoxine biosynthesis transcription factor PdxR [Agromyces ramosus]|uniref:GntR family transcriptional regulator/MocR family aminotransferase n=1 Tax=Agromyces ramosus TaxID=33879 RepID=A0ABU0R6T3_9MICO|nr:PLP-dependent aminotransferase family protein [Agromyces ramosus]MDQ0893796.1 GntR family transcriptional regulator/MocR family aminotransferase [Agromyces ramosus]